MKAIAVALPMLIALTGAVGAEDSLWAEAEKYGITQEVAQSLCRRMNESTGSYEAQDLMRAYKEKKLNLAPYLMHLLGKDSLLVSLDGKNVKLSRNDVAMYLAFTRDRDGSDLLVEYTRKRMPVSIRTSEEDSSFSYLMMCLGWSAGDKALDFLFRVQSKEYWESLEAPTVELAHLQGKSDQERKEGREARILSLRLNALTAISESGAERALKAFATGKGVAEDLRDRVEKDHEYYFDKAAAIALGYHKPPVTDFLTKEERKKFKKLFASYNRKYTTTFRNLNEEKISPPHPRRRQ